MKLSPPPGPAIPPGGNAELRRRITRLMLVRVVFITLVLGTTIGVHFAEPEALALPSTVALFAIVGATYFLTLGYALAISRIQRPLLLADIQVAADLVVTTALVHVTGGAQSGYTFFYPLSIIGAALLRYRRGAALAAGASVTLYTMISLAGWMRWLPVPAGQRVLPWEPSSWDLTRHLVLNGSAFVAIAALASFLGEQLRSAGERLETQRAHTADLAALNDDIIRCLSSGLVTTDREGVVVRYNEAAEEILGQPRSKVLGHPLAEHFPELARLLAPLAARDAIRRGELELEHAKSDARTLGFSVSPLTDHKDLPIGRIMNFQDLTELRRMETQVRRAQRLAVVGELAASMAHEIRNPLASISGSIELLRSGPQVDDENRALMEIVLREVDRLNGLVSDLLDYARPRERVMASLELGALLAETLRVFSQDRSNTGITARLDVSPAMEEGRPNVYADADQLRQVFWNLLRNAGEAMSQGGEIKVAIARDAGPEGAVIEASVTDQGVGIPPEKLDRIFDPFYTTKTFGSGLGLALVHRIVSEHGGAVFVDSTPGHGTRVTVRLPAHDPVASGEFRALAR